MDEARDLGELLVKRGVLTARQLDTARRREVRQKIPLHRALTDLSLASEEEIYRALAEITGLVYVDPSELSVNREVLEAVPVKLALHYRMVPVSLEGGLLTLAFAEPPGAPELGRLRLLLTHRIQVRLTTPSAVHAFIRRNYGLGAETILQLRRQDDEPDSSREIVFDVHTPAESSPLDASISQFVNQILSEALRLEATDIHLEPYLETVRLRYRIDGLLQDIPLPAGLRQLYPSLVSRLKVMADLNITERRIPHDGRISMKLGDRDYDLRVSIIPTTFGEAVCLRILGQQSLLINLAQLGMEPPQQALMEELTRLPQGLVLLTGPTGSGKTTTLYAALAHASDEARKIITIENPVEYKLAGVSQIQVREEVGLGFTSGLRSVLRHDPDVILIGEIRDTETAEIAIRSAQTGHLVFSTLHTNDSVSAITRLIEMGVEPFLVGSSVVCSIAQRLARRICRHCQEPDPDIPQEMRDEMVAALGIDPGEVKAMVGRGCVECTGRGTRGRVALYEFLVLTDPLADAIEPGLKTGRLRELARSEGWRSLRETAWTKVREGLVSIDELQRLTRRLGPPPLPLTGPGS
ncbi:MAG: type II/IV secretion system protein [Puniceicoccaceae bacterium]|nr:MAG: type II/IV secretion system protein [Puniceicoccaceae bacterium]